MAEANAAMLALTCLKLAHPRCQVAMLLTAEDYPPHLRSESEVLYPDSRYCGRSALYLHRSNFIIEVAPAQDPRCYRWKRLELGS